jgi:hypothetical protein
MLTVGQSGDAKILQIVVGDLRQKIVVNPILSKRFRVLAEPQALKPLLNIAAHASAPVAAMFTLAETAPRRYWQKWRLGYLRQINLAKVSQLRGETAIPDDAQQKVDEDVGQAVELVPTGFPTETVPGELTLG